MTISEILEEIKNTSGANDKKAILEKHKNNEVLVEVLRAGLDPFMVFHVVKVPKVKERNVPENELLSWNSFFMAANACMTREVTGNDAVSAMHRVFAISSEDNEKWMRKILKKHLAIGASTKTINKIFPGLIPTFNVSLAQKFDEKRLEGKKMVYVEPKLDGIRCFAIVENSNPVLYARSGKVISNFGSTIGAELAKLPDGCYDGEIMGKDFTALMRQAYRKENVETEGTYFALFDYMSLESWEKRECSRTTHMRYAQLYSMIQTHKDDFEYLRLVPRVSCPADYKEILVHHDKFVKQGYEGVMIKDMKAPYKFGRGYEVMKLKAFHDADLKIKSLLEGTGKHAGKLGSVIVDFEGVEVQVGSGFSDALRDQIWEDPENFIGRVIEVRYQEVTPDGSLRFPTFVCFRNDR